MKCTITQKYKSTELVFCNNLNYIKSLSEVLNIQIDVLSSVNKCTVGNTARAHKRKRNGSRLILQWMVSTQPNTSADETRRQKNITWHMRRDTAKLAAVELSAYYLHV